MIQKSTVCVTLPAWLLLWKKWRWQRISFSFYVFYFTSVSSRYIRLKRFCQTEISSDNPHISLYLFLSKNRITLIWYYNVVAHVMKNSLLTTVAEFLLYKNKIIHSFHGLTNVYEFDYFCRIYVNPTSDESTAWHWIKNEKFEKKQNFPGKFVLQVEARDGLGSGPFTDNAEIVIDIQSINNHRPVITNPALTNSSVDIQGVSFCFALSFRSNLIDSFN